jgi:hypothetical protein
MALLQILKLLAGPGLQPDNNQPVGPYGGGVNPSLDAGRPRFPFGTQEEFDVSSLLAPSTPGGPMGDPDSTAFDNSNAGISALLRSRPGPLAMPNDVTPAWRTQDAVAGLGGMLLAQLLGGSKAAGAYGMNYIQGKQGKAQRETQRGRENVLLRNQQDDQQWQDNVRAGQFDAGVEGDKRTRAISAKTRAEDVEFRNKQQDGLNERARLKNDAKAVDQQLKAFGMRYGLSREAALDAMYDRDMVSDELYAKLRPTIGKPTTGEAKDTAQTTAAIDKNARDQAMHLKRLADYDKDWAFREKQLTANEAKWKRDFELRQRGEDRRSDEFEWRKKNAGGIAKIDKQVFDLQQKKKGLLAIAQEWHRQNPQIFGQEVNTQQSKEALNKLRRDIAEIDARIEGLRSMGGSDAIERKRQDAQTALSQPGLSEKDKNFIRQEFFKDTGIRL